MRPLSVARIRRPSTTATTLSRCARTSLPHRLMSPVCTDISHRSVNEVICHGIPDQRKLQEGDIINIGLSSPYAPPFFTADLDFVADVSLYHNGLPSTRLFFKQLD